MFLTKSQLIEITKKKYATAQARQLDIMGIPYRKRGDKSLVVSANVVENLLGLDYSVQINQTIEPNWSILENAQVAQ